MARGIGALARLDGHGRGAHHCNTDYDGYCGSIKRALDPTGGVKGNITIGFEYYPRFDQVKAQRIAP